MKSPWIDQKSKASASSVGSVGWDSRFNLKFSAENFAHNGRFPPKEWVLGIRCLFLMMLLNHLPQEIKNLSLCALLGLLFHSVFWDKFLMRLTFQICFHNISFPILPPRLVHSQERHQVILSCQIDEFLIDLSLKSGDIQPFLLKELLTL